MNQKTKHQLAIFFSTITFTLLSSCGGGGASEGNSNATYDGVMTQSNLPSSIDSSRWFKDILLVTQGFTSGSSFYSIQNAKDNNSSKKSPFAKKLPQADQTTTTACPNGGSVVETIKIEAAALRITYTESFKDCIFSDGNKISGDHTEVFNSPETTGDLITGWTSTNEIFKNIAIQTGQENFILNGTRDNTKTYIYPGSITSTKIESKLNIVMKDNVNNRKVFFSNFGIDEINDYTTQEFGFKLSGNIFDSRFGLAIINSTPLKFADDKYFPTSGKFVLGFANGSLKGSASATSPGDLLQIEISKFNPQTMMDEVVTSNLDTNMLISSSLQIPSATITAPISYTIVPGVFNSLHADAFSSSDTPGDILSYEWKIYLLNNPNSVLQSGNSAEFWFIPQAAGTYVLELTATDLLGNKSLPTTQQVEVSTQ